LSAELLQELQKAGLESFDRAVLPHQIFHGRRLSLPAQQVEIRQAAASSTNK